MEVYFRRRRGGQAGTTLALTGGMSSIRVFTIAQLPPGKGRVVEVDGRQVTVYNCDGRFYATCTRPSRRTSPLHADSSYCGSRGLSFDVWAEDSPASLDDESRCQISIDGDDVVLVVP